MSSEHHTIKVMPPTEQKKDYECKDKQMPEIISHYNANKGDVDTVDNLISTFTCRRKSNRWTMNCFFYILDVAASNAFILFALNKNIKNETLFHDVQRQRKKGFEDLALSLITKRKESRATQLDLTNFKGVKSDVQEIFKRSLNLEDLSAFKTHPKKPIMDQSPKSRRCEYCHHLPQNKLSALKTQCQDCNKFCCKNHSTTFTTIICNNCNNQ